MNDVAEHLSTVVDRVVDPSDRGALERAVLAVRPQDVVDALHGTSADAPAGLVLGRGLPVSPGVGRGVVCTDAEAALDRWDAGDEVVLLVAETRPADEPAMRVCAAVVTERGGTASHAAVVARELGIPAVCGTGPLRIEAGTEVTVDGGAGEIRSAEGAGADAPQPSSSAADRLPPALATLLDWADELVGGRMVVMANADRAEAARRARAFGAAGIGLCRVEHVFLGAHAPLIGHLLEDAGAAASLAAVEELLAGELSALLAQMDGLPVTVRLLDAPAHEFGGPAEHDPMLGLRGVRLGLVRPELVTAQARALAAARDAHRRAGGRPVLRVLVPLVSLAGEMERTAELLGEVLGPDVPVGAMVETPRAALCAAELAVHAEFFSIGSNDLTQLTYGWSRDDLEARLLGPYRQAGILETSPFHSLDQLGVARLMALAVDTGRAVRPGMPVGLCGEHGGDPDSVAVAMALGIDTVSCSPWRVPVARLAAAHAALCAVPERG